MTYTIDDVRRQAMLLLDDAPQNSGLFDIMCTAAAAELERKLRHPMQSEQETQLFLAAAGMLALSMYLKADDTAFVTDFKAGSVQIQCGRSEAADALRTQAEHLLAEYIGDRDFAFVGVRG